MWAARPRTAASGCRTRSSPASELIIPPSDFTLEETRKLFTDEGLIPDLPVAVTPVHWDDVEPNPDEEGHFAATWRFLGRAGGAKDYTVNRIDIVPNRWSTPAHVEDEEIFYVLRGSGLSWQDGEVYEVREGDCIVHRAGREAHTLRAGRRRARRARLRPDAGTTGTRCCRAPA